MKMPLSSWQYLRIAMLLVSATLVFVACQPTPDTLAPTLTTQPASIQPSQTPSPAPENTPEPTAIPSRDDSLQYEVQPGDTLSSIAATFGLSPQTVLWANFDLLFDNPDFLMQGMLLEIFPADGLMHQVGGIDTISGLATFFGVEPEAITTWPANNINSSAPEISAGQWLFIPGGLRQSRWRQMPDIPRESAALDYAEYGDGACPANYEGGALGDGEYAWPVQSREILGESFSAWHPAIDVATVIGEHVLAADTGVIVFSGWSNFGYGNLAMIDHGNGSYSLYAGLSSLLVPCGQGVIQGDPIALAANTGYPAGPILHFEIRQSGQSIDPLSLLP